MSCTAYGSTSGLALYYATDADPDAAAASTITWTPVPITSESLALTLTSTVSERITPERSFAGSVVTQGEVSGSFGFELESGAFVNTMFQAALQASGTWSAGAAIKNGSTPTCLMFLKVVANPTGTDYYVFRGCQIDSLSVNVAPGSLITGEISVMGMRQGAGAVDATDGSNAVLTAKPAGWTLSASGAAKLMSSVYAIQNFEVQNSSGVDQGLIAQEVSFTLSNSLRQQFAVGTGQPYAAGVASGRFSTTISANAYYSGAGIVNLMQNDSNLKVTFDLLDGDDDGWTFLWDFAKITSAPPPSAGGPDQDLMSQTELQGFESTSNGSIKITRSA